MLCHQLGGILCVLFLLLLSTCRFAHSPVAVVSELVGDSLGCWEEELAVRKSPEICAPEPEEWPNECTRHGKEFSNSKSG